MPKAEVAVEEALVAAREEAPVAAATAAMVVAMTQAAAAHLVAMEVVKVPVAQRAAPVAVQAAVRVVPGVLVQVVVQVAPVALGAPVDQARALEAPGATALAGRVERVVEQVEAGPVVPAEQAEVLAALVVPVREAQEPAGQERVEAVGPVQQAAPVRARETEAPATAMAMLVMTLTVR